MKEFVYELRIEGPEEALTGILGEGYEDGEWVLRLVEGPTDDYVPFLEIFNHFLEKHFEELNRAGIDNDQISIWLLYQYDGQCNLEFHPHQLEMLARMGVTFCLTCWEGSSHSSGSGTVLS